MTDHRKIVVRNSLPAYQKDENEVDSVGEVELGFRGAFRRSCYERFRDDQFCFQYNKVEEGVEAHKYSPPLWKKNITSNESSPLLSSDHKYSNLSPPMRLQAILEARKELMEMIRNMPENSYELSLKDLVDHEKQTNREENKEDSAVFEDERRSFRFETEDQIKNHKKKKKKMMMKKKRMISMSTSMDSGTVLIKIFFPSFLGSKRKSTNKNVCSEVSPRTSLEISDRKENDHDDHKENWIKSIFLVRENIGNGKNGGGGGTKSNNSSTNRQAVVSNYFTPGCWPFFHYWKSKATRQRGCFF